MNTASTALARLAASGFTESPTPPPWGLIVGSCFVLLGAFGVRQMLGALRDRRTEAESRGEARLGFVQTVRTLPNPLRSTLIVGLFLVGGLFLIVDDVMAMAS